MEPCGSRFGQGRRMGSLRISRLRFSLTAALILINLLLCRLSPQRAIALTIHPAAQVAAWKRRLQAFLWHPDTTVKQASQISQALLKSGHLTTRNEYSEMMATLGDRGCWAEAVEVFARMQRLPIAERPDLVACNTLIRVLGKAERWEQALDVLMSLPSMKFEPNQESMNHALMACAKGGCWEQAIHLLTAMESSGFVPEMQGWCAVVRACRKGGEPGTALWLVHDMEERQIFPDVLTYTSAMRACEELGEWERALAYFDAMFAQGLSPNVYAYLAAMRACSTNGQHEEALRLFGEIRMIGLNENVPAFRFAVESCEKLGRWEEALSIFDRYLIWSSQLEEEMCESLLRALVQAGQLQKANTLLKDWISKGFYPSKEISQLLATAKV